jgi:hypothetical protein
MNLGVPAMLEVAKQFLNHTAMEQSDRFYLVAIPDDGEPDVHEFEKIDTLIDQVIASQGQNTTLFCFVGKWMYIAEAANSPGLQYLNTPAGNVPLFKMPKPGELKVNRTGWMGKGPRELTIPKEAPKPADKPAEAAVPAKEEEIPLFSGGHGP